MRDSLEVIQAAKYEKADIIVISDGVGNISLSVKEDYTNGREAKKAHAYGVLLATKSDLSIWHADEKLQSLTDRMITITDLKNSDPVFSLLFTL